MTAGEGDPDPVYLGVMSGTSLDGVDVAAVEYGGSEERPSPARLLKFRTFPYDDLFRRRLSAALSTGSPEILCELNFALGRRFAESILRALDRWELGRDRVRAVGSHGQTVWHAPPGDGERGSTLQLGEPAVVVEQTGLPLVADFRVRDVAAGGHGAPLTPYFDRLLLRGESGRAVQNLGGMGNVTVLPPSGSDAVPTAFDTGPGVALLDAAAELLTGGRQTFDRDGEMAAGGEVLPGPLREWLEDPFFSLEPPRSTGRERFGTERLERWAERHGDETAADLMATLTELTARSVADGLARVPLEPEELYLCGGGARNPELRRRIARLVAPLPVRNLEELGWNGDAREAAAFALLTRQHVEDIPVDLSWATGAEGARRLGKWVPA